MYTFINTTEPQLGGWITVYIYSIPKKIRVCNIPNIIIIIQKPENIWKLTMEPPKKMLRLRCFAFFTGPFSGLPAVRFPPSLEDDVSPGKSCGLMDDLSQLGGLKHPVNQRFTLTSPNHLGEGRWWLQLVLMAI